MRVMKTEPITQFSGDYRWLSNFFLAEVRHEGITYPSNEHAFQAAKTLDRQQRSRFTEEVITCGNAKRLGRKLALRPDWEAVKDGVMYSVCLDKFQRHVNLAQLLLKTDDADLVEGNTWSDFYWGVCNGRGQNRLGKILMAIRTRLVNGSVA